MSYTHIYKPILRSLIALAILSGGGLYAASNLIVCEHNPSVIDKKLTLPNEIVPIDFEFTGIVVAEDHSLEFTKEVSDLLKEIESLEKEIDNVEAELNAENLTVEEKSDLQSKLIILNNRFNILEEEGMLCTNVDVYGPIINNGIFSIGTGAHMHSQSSVINNGTFSILDSKECVDFWNEIDDSSHYEYSPFQQWFNGPLNYGETLDLSFKNNRTLKISDQAIAYFTNLQNNEGAIIEVSDMARLEGYLTNNAGGIVRFKDNSLMIPYPTQYDASNMNIGEMYFNDYSGILIDPYFYASFQNYCLLDLSNISNLGNFNCKIQNFGTIRLPRNVEAGIDKTELWYGNYKTLIINNTPMGKIEYHATYPILKNNKIVIETRTEANLKDYIKFMGIDIYPASTTFSPIENDTLTLSDLASMSNINVRGVTLDIPQDLLISKVEEDTFIEFDLNLNKDAKLEVFKKLTIIGDIKGPGTIIIHKGGSIDIQGKIIGCCLKNQGRITHIKGTTYKKPEHKIYDLEEVFPYY